MAKIPRGRITGLHGMESQTAEELHAWADRFERRAGCPGTSDDPGWLRRWAKRLRCLAEQKEQAREHKAAREQRPAEPDPGPDVGFLGRAAQPAGPGRGAGLFGGREGEAMATGGEPTDVPDGAEHFPEDCLGLHLFTLAVRADVEQTAGAIAALLGPGWA